MIWWKDERMPLGWRVILIIIGVAAVFMRDVILAGVAFAAALVAD